MKTRIPALWFVLILVTAGVASAQTFTLQAGGGVLDPNTDINLDTRSWVFASFRIRLFMEDFYFEPEVARWSHPAQVGGQDDFEDIQIGGNLIFTYPFSTFELFFGGGLAVHFLDGDLSVAGLELSGTKESRLGTRFIGGLDLILHRNFSIFGAVRYQVVFNADEEQLIIYGGARLRL